MRYLMITLCNLPGRLMMTAMRGRWLVWIGAAIAVAALAGLGFYMARVGLEKADQLASVLGLVVAVTGLGIIVYGLVAARRDGRSSAGSGRSEGGVWQNADASGQAEMVQAGRDINESPAAQPGPAGHNAEDAHTDAAADIGDTGDADHSGGERSVVRQRATATEGGRVYQAGRDFTEGPVARSGPDAQGADADRESRDVSQRAKARGNGRVYQTGRDINKR
ncbi:hypothetical protein [Herbidospora cretacea]|uniref:hypothetical protein n=1 Tax=Herbidospora cretacea TaxID=28444 RepID=UPI0004C446E8|nr:hypothetical protein [Herbidospora cretacea]